MKPSPLRTPLAVLRAELGLSQKSIGEIVGRKRRTIQAIELDKLRLTEDLADRIAKATGVSMQWLLGGDPNQPMISAEGKPYTKEDFEAVRGRSLTIAAGRRGSVEVDAELTRKLQDPRDPGLLYMRSAYATADWFPILAAAARVGKREVAEYLMLEFLDKMGKRFGYDFETAQKIDGKVEFTAEGEKMSFTIPQRTQVGIDRALKEAAPLPEK